MHHAQLFPNYEKYNDQERKLIDRAVSTLYGNIISRPADDENFVFKNRKAISPSPRTYQGVWNWDSAFHTLAMSYFDIEIAHDQMKILFDYQKSDGQIADVVYTNGKAVFRFTKPPVLAWAIMKSNIIQPDLSFFGICLSSLKTKPFVVGRKQVRRYTFQLQSSQNGKRMGQYC